MFTAGSLFSGIGGLDLGLDRAGFDIRYQVEIDPFCQIILKKHWPQVTLFSDIKQVKKPETVDLLFGGFPCQPVSVAGRRKAQEDERWLWPEFLRIIKESQPKLVLIENVIGLRTKGLENVIKDLSDAGYDAEWGDLAASQIGAAHQRKRLFIIGYSRREGLSRFMPILGIRGFEKPSSALIGNTAITVGGWWGENISNLRMGDGIPLRVARKRIKAYGNAVVPQLAETIGIQLYSILS